MLRITQINANNEKVDATIDEKRIVGTREIKVAPTELYDANGNVVSTTENESIYAIFLDNGAEVRVEKATHDKLMTELKVKTL